MKNLYFVRHGESLSNAGKAGIGSDPELSEKGRLQAKNITERCSSLDVDLIISSTMRRAKETAEIINNTLKKPIEFSNLFVERKLPSEFDGVSEEEWNGIRAGGISLKDSSSVS